METGKDDLEQKNPAGNYINHALLYNVCTVLCHTVGQIKTQKLSHFCCNLCEDKGDKISFHSAALTVCSGKMVWGVHPLLGKQDLFYTFFNHLLCSHLITELVFLMFHWR